MGKNGYIVVVISNNNGLSIKFGNLPWAKLLPRDLIYVHGG